MAEIVRMGTRFSRFSRYVPETIRTYLPAWLAQNQAAMAIDPYLRGEHPLPVASNTQSTQEREQLRRMATTPYGRLILNSTTQALNLRGVRMPGEEEVPTIWKEFWLKNKMLARQNAINRSAIGYGQAYTTVLPGQIGIKAEDGLIIRNYTPKTMTAFFQEAWDEYPAVALNGDPQIDERGQQYWLFQLFDEEAVHYAYVYELQLGNPKTIKIEYLESRTHESDVTPVVYHTPLVDDDGGSRGEILPFLPIISRLDQSVYDRLLIQRQAAWRVRTAAGVARPQGKSAKERMEATLKAGDLLTSDKPDTKFGTLDASSMLEHVETRNSDLKDLATATQTPVYMLTGESTNVTAEALSAISSGYQQRIEQNKRALGMSYEKIFDLGAHQDPSLGEPESGLEMRWAEFRPYSLTQISDALGKLAQQLEIDPTLLYEYVPFMSDDDVERAAEKRQEMKDEAMAMAQAEAAAAQQGGDGADPTANSQAQRNRAKGSAADAGQNKRS